jgi:hypothetical protein
MKSQIPVRHNTKALYEGMKRGLPVKNYRERKKKSSTLLTNL